MIYAKPEDIKIGTKIAMFINGIVMFKGEVNEIAYEGISIKGTEYIGGYFKWGKDSRMSFSIGEDNNTFILI